MQVPRLATVKGKEKRVIGVIGIEKIEGAKVKVVIAWNSGKERVEKVVFLFVELGVENTEDLVELSASAVHLRQIGVIDNDSERILAEIVVLEFDLFDALRKFSYVLRFCVVCHNVVSVSILPVHLANERC